MDVNGYTIDRVDPKELSEQEQIALARLFQRMSKEIVPEDPERPLDAILSRIRAKSANEWHAWARARDAKGNVVGWIATSAYRAPVPFFWLFNLPPIWREDRDFSERMYLIHGWIGILIALFVLGHIGAALFHHFIRKDEILVRMLRS